MPETLLPVRALSLAHGGEAVCLPTNPQVDQRKIFVHGLIPGETAEVSVTEEHPRFRRALVSKIIESSPNRVIPPCSYFSRCGGCNLQFMPIDLQRQIKLDMVSSMLARQAKVSSQNGVSLLGPELPAFEYRRRITIHISPSAGPKPAQLGFFREGSGEVVDIGVCMIAAPLLNCAAKKLRSILHLIDSSFAAVIIEEFEGVVFLAAKLREDALERVDEHESPAIKALANEFENCCVLDCEKPIFSQFQGTAESLDHRAFPIGRFSQVNLEGNEILKEKVSSLVTHRDITDLYAGAGNFSIPLAKKDHLVDAVELDPELIAFGRLAAFKNGVADNRLTFIEASCERYVRSHKLKTTVLLDPPRSGADAVAKVLNPKITRQVVYVSCSLPTLCRDVKTLTDKGYNLVEMWVVDMFSQTHHVETISLLEAAG